MFGSSDNSLIYPQYVQIILQMILIYLVYKNSTTKS